MANRLKIGLDLDGVIIDHTSNRVLKARELGYDIKPAETMRKIIKKIMAPEHYKKLQRYIYGPASLLAPEMRGAASHIAQIAAENDLYIISRRSASEGWNKFGLKWLENHGLLNFIPVENIFFVPHDVKSAKNEVAEKHGIEIFLDDDLEILNEMRFVKNRVLFDQFIISKTPIQYHKVTNWREFSNFVQKLKY